jgi:hypothetical protein
MSEMLHQAWNPASSSFGHQRFQVQNHWVRGYSSNYVAMKLAATAVREKKTRDNN